jgi:hypothetical protein
LIASDKFRQIDLPKVGSSESLLGILKHTAKRALTVIALLFSTVVAGISVSPAVAVETCSSPAGANDVSLIICEESGTLIARAPLSASGDFTQEMSITIDPAKTPLSASNQIVAPAGWTISYFNGTSWSTTAPAAPNEWSAVTKVKAVGPFNSQGIDNGQQITSRSQTVALAQSGSFTGGAGGDGWSVFFDDNNHVFNIFHHNGGTQHNPAVDCHTRTGGSCGPGWPYALSPYQTNNQSEGWVDNTNKHLWFETNTDTGTGFACLDLNDLATGPSWCGGTAAAAFVQTGTNGGGSYGETGALAAVGTRVFTWETDTGKLMCADTALNGGLGGVCPDQPISFSGVSSAPYGGGQSLLAHNGKLYGVAGTKAICINPLTFASCSGWPFDLSNPGLGMFVLPGASGIAVGICFIDTQDTGNAGGVNYANATSTSINPCYDFSGSAITRPSSLVLRVSNAYSTYGKNPETAGSRVYWAASWVNDGHYYCWDAALNSGAGAYCGNWPISSWPTYTIQVDPLNSNCLWSNADSGGIKTWDAVRGASGCQTPPSTVEFDPNLIVPRMRCNVPAAITGWKSFSISSPAATTYSSASLTVTKNNGDPIANWTNVTVPGTRIVDLSQLPLAETGQNPKFLLTFAWTGTGSPTAPTASVAALAGQPELCITPQIVTSNCPTTLGPLTSIPAEVSNVLADGVASLSGTDTSLVQASKAVSLNIPMLANCSAQLAGKATRSDGTTPIVGATVTLLDGSGNQILVNGSPVTTTTNQTGHYSFGTLTVGVYKVQFADRDTNATVQSSVVAQGGSGTTTSIAGLVTSEATTLAIGQNGVVDAIYVVTEEPSLASTGQNVDWPLLWFGFSLVLLGTIGYAFSRRVR